MNVVVYTDASEYAKRLGFGIVVICNNKIIDTLRLIRRKKVLKCSECINVEHLAIKLGITFVLSKYKNISHIKLRTDDQGIIKKLIHRKQFRSDFKINVLRNTPCEISWVKGHYNNPYNKLADMLAKPYYPHSEQQILNIWYRTVRFVKQPNNKSYLPMKLKLK